MSSRPPVMSAQTAALGRRREHPEEMSALGHAQQQAKRICVGCPIRMECLAEALDGRHEFGVWGGLTEHERRALLRRRPDVHDWHDLLTQAQAAYQHPPSAQPATSRTQPAQSVPGRGLTPGKS